MNVTTAPTLFAPPWAPPWRRTAGRVATAIALVALGDWLFWGWSVGWSWPIFIVCVAIAVCLTNRVRASRGTVGMAGAALVLGLFPSVESAGLLSAGFSLLGLAVFATAVTTGGDRTWAERVGGALRLTVMGPAELTADVRRTARAGGTGALRWPGGGQLLGWALPVGMMALFLTLLSEANPILEAWLARLDPANAASLLDGWRIAAWCLVLCAIRPFLAVRLRPMQARSAPRAASPDAAWLRDEVFGHHAILRSLVLFNALFAVQTGLDAMYLWGGAALPAGTTYAAYAHRGAHPLIATALLAAAFVLVAMREGGPGERSQPIRLLVYLFVAQNAGLVLSSILRLNLYVSAYLLTELRVYAFIWMGLVLTGLGLIAVRIALSRSNAWLVRANLAALAATFYACSFVDTAALVAAHNLDRLDARGTAAVDIPYLRSLGPAIVPAIDRTLVRGTTSRGVELTFLRLCLADRWHEGRNWREWDARSWRLAGHLRRIPNASIRPAIERNWCGSY